MPGDETDDEGQPASSDDKTSRVWLIPVTGGEALPLYTEKLEAHSYAWSADSASIYFSVTTPLTPEQQDAQKEQWKDVIRWREQDRGDLLLKLNVAAAVDRALSTPPPEKPSDQNRGKKKEKDKEKPAELPAGAEIIARSALSIGEVAPSPDGKAIAYMTEPMHKRMETPQSYEIFLAGPAAGGALRQITHNDAVESSLRWSPDGHWLHFMVAAGFGSLDGKYRDVQGRLFRLDPSSGSVERLGGSFDGSFDQFALLRDGRELAIGTKRTERRLYLVEGTGAKILPGPAGSYTGLSTAPEG